MTLPRREKLMVLWGPNGILINPHMYGVPPQKTHTHTLCVLLLVGRGVAKLAPEWRTDLSKGARDPDPSWWRGVQFKNQNNMFVVEPPMLLPNKGYSKGACLLRGAETEPGVSSDNTFDFKADYIQCERIRKSFIWVYLIDMFHIHLVTSCNSFQFPDFCLNHSERCAVKQGMYNPTRDLPHSKSFRARSSTTQ